MSAKKTDNHNAALKLAVRRHFLRAYHGTTAPDVVDCFSGYAVLWTQLRAEFAVAHYTGIEMRTIPGRLHMDSLDYLRRRDWQHDVIDLDAYGSPWKHLLAALPNIKHDTTVFLTVGRAVLGQQDRELMSAAGIDFPVPVGLHNGLADYLTAVGLALPRRFGLRIIEARQAVCPAGPGYFGLRIGPPAPQESGPTPPAKKNTKRQK